MCQKVRHAGRDRIGDGKRGSNNESKRMESKEEGRWGHNRFPCAHTCALKHTPTYPHHTTNITHLRQAWEGGSPDNVLCTREERIFVRRAHWVVEGRGHSLFEFLALALRVCESKNPTIHEGPYFYQNLPSIR